MYTCLQMDISRFMALYKCSSSYYYKASIDRRLSRPSHSQLYDRSDRHTLCTNSIDAVECRHKVRPFQVLYVYELRIWRLVVAHAILLCEMAGN